jgi:hypothetical protein
LYLIREILNGSSKKTGGGIGLKSPGSNASSGVSSIVNSWRWRGVTYVSFMPRIGRSYPP